MQLTTKLKRMLWTTGAFRISLKKFFLCLYHQEADSYSAEYEFIYKKRLFIRKSSVYSLMSKAEPWLIAEEGNLDLAWMHLEKWAKESWNPKGHLMIWWAKTALSFQGRERIWPGEQTGQGNPHQTPVYSRGLSDGREGMSTPNE